MSRPSYTLRVSDFPPQRVSSATLRAELAAVRAAPYGAGWADGGGVWQIWSMLRDQPKNEKKREDNGGFKHLDMRPELGEEYLFDKGKKDEALDAVEQVIKMIEDREKLSPDGRARCSCCSRLLMIGDAGDDLLSLDRWSSRRRHFKDNMRLRRKGCNTAGAHGEEKIDRRCLNARCRAISKANKFGPLRPTRFSLEGINTAGLPLFG